MQADLTAAVRALTASKIFTATTVAVMALDLGAITAVFAVVNAAAVSAVFGAQEPLGNTLEIGDTTYTVVGVVGNARQSFDAAAEPEMQMHVSAGGAELQAFGAELVLRVSDARASTTTLAADLRRLVSEVMPGGAVRYLQAGDEQITMHLAWRRQETVLLAVLAALGLSIAAIGVYGVLAYAVEHRTREIGIRMALGALPRAVLQTVLGETGVLVAAGLAAGGVAAWWLSAAVRSRLFELEPRDPASFAAAMAAMAITAALASVLPARQIVRVDPAETLRAE